MRMHQVRACVCQIFGQIGVQILPLSGNVAHDPLQKGTARHRRTLRCGMPQPDAHLEFRTEARVAAREDFASHQYGQRAGDRKSQPRTAESPGGRDIRLVEGETAGSSCRSIPTPLSTP